METVRVDPGRLPPTMRATPNSPTVCAKLRTMPATIPGRASGTTIRAKVRARDAPRHHAVSIRLRSTAAKAAAERLDSERQTVEDRRDQQSLEGKDNGLA